MSTSLHEPIGFRLDGRPFWGFSGGDGEGDGDGGDSGSGDGADGGTTETDPVKVLETTLSKVRLERKAAQDAFRPYKAALRELGIDSPEALKAALAKGAGAGASGDGKQPETVDVEKVREQARLEVRQEANREIALAQVEAKAKGMFADPDDAVAFLRGSVDDLLGRDGRPDPKVIERELGDLLEAKPHWGIKKEGDVSFDGGARQSGGGKQSMDTFLRQKSREKRG